MLKVIIEAYNNQNFALIEAGTGIWKSLAYLLPAIFSAHENGERTVISTHTITLQEQLLQKDIPFITDTLNFDLEAILVKGMGNYLCLRKLYDLLDHPSLHSIDEQEELHHVENWAKETLDGSISDLEKLPKKLGWEKLNCESDACSFVKCPSYNNCFFFKARKKCKDAKVLVANHHVLMADLQMRSIEENQGILPDYEHLIIDEAHTLEEIATRSLASSISSQYILRRLNELVSERGNTGKLQRLQLIILEHSGSIEEKLNQKVFDLLSEKRATQSLIMESFLLFAEFLNKYYSSNEGKLALDPTTRKEPEFENITTEFSKLIEHLKGFTQNLNSLIERISDIQEAYIIKKMQNVVIDTKSIILFLEKTTRMLEEFFKAEISPHKVYVIEWDQEKSLSAIRLLIIQLNIADILSRTLFTPRDSAILCSATLCHNKQFSFIKSQLGFDHPEIQERGVTEKILASPFNYPEKVLLATPADMPEPHSYHYQQMLCKYLLQATQASVGGAFILFTSYKTLNQCYEEIANKLVENGLLPLKQGDENRNTLLKMFKERPNSVLFGTDTFWEGIDVPGFHLRMVIITKLPFPVPTEPLFQAKCKQIDESGKNSFLEYSVPKAIVKFKQGFGRLIRTKQDFGTILCLDSRLITKRYGHYFFNSLPDCQKFSGSFNEIKSKLERFYEGHKEWSVTESNR